MLDASAPKRILLTGAAGFIAHHVADHILKATDWGIVALDRIDHTSTQHRLTDMESWPTERSRIEFVWHDLKSALNDHLTLRIGHVDMILHLAASTHVDRSISNPMEFVQDNVIGTVNLLEWARTHAPNARTIVMSTDEVFGSAPEGTHFAEWDRHRPGNPYAAAKSAAEQMCYAYHNTYKSPVMVARSMNVFGERQHHEKFIPGVIRKVLMGEKVLIHADATRTKPGARFYIHARNVAAALMFILEKGELGQSYNIAGEREINNLQMATMISNFVREKRPDVKALHCELVDFHGSRPGHDLRYALDGTRMRELGFAHPLHIDESLRAVVHWALENPKWLGL